ncbi:MAG: DUF2190 family protein [Nitrospinae bacterium]|nr:DUF2190 family protein [Nitrospinota bacterium]
MHTPILIKNFTSDSAIAPYRIVAIGAADGSVKQASVSTDALLGVTDSLGSNSANRVDVIQMGVVNVEYGGNVTRGDLLTADANGKAVKATAHTHTENTAGAYAQNATTAAGSMKEIIGRAMVSGVSGDIGSVQINLGQI